MTDKDQFWNLISKKLSGEASPDELLALEKMLRSDPELHYPSQTITDLWKPTELPVDNALHAFRLHAERMERLGIDFHPVTDQQVIEPEVVSVKKNKRILVAAAFIAIGAVAAFWMSDNRQQNTLAATAELNNRSEIFTRNGSKTNVVLPDGTQVWLNAGSRLLYDKQYGNTIREVTLSGEAFFDVVKNKEKPFVIHTGKVDIRVLGTAFNVKAYPGEKTTETSLVRGSVEVTIKDRPAEKVILKPNEKLVVLNDEALPTARLRKPVSSKKEEPIVAISHLTYTKRDSVVLETAWVQNKLVFEDESFRDLAKKMERWYGVNILFNDAALDTIRFTGSFSNETIQQALAALKLSGHFSYSIRNNQITITK